MIGRTISHYRVVDRIGEGGMGVVYRAHDVRLDRDVALKVLTANLLADRTAGKRFRHEARALSRLNHPNICAVYDFDSEQGISFLAMEYVSGMTLADVVRARELPEDEVVRLGLQLAEGLAAAHGEGVVHRDLKPSNLALTRDGRLKILDFGIAKLTETAPPDGATMSALETQGIAGTVAYMAPEQLRGGVVDARTDIYSAGVVLYELTTGRRPFDGPAAPVLTDAILHMTPIAPGRLRPEMSPALEGIVLRCLEKDPALRYQSADDLVADLRRHQAHSSAAFGDAAPTHAGRRGVPARALVAALAVVLLAVIAGVFAFNPFGVRDRLSGRPSAAAPHIESLGVLPFENLSRDPSQDYFVAGMTEALTSAISQIPTIRVKARTTMAQFSRALVPIPEIARLIDADAVIEGSVLRDGNRVAITARLMATNPEREVWSHSYNRELRDVLALHSEVAQAIADAIQTKLSPETQTRLSRTPPVNTAAYEAYLRGRVLFAIADPERVAAAESAFRQAIAVDPNFAPAYSSLAYLYLWSGVLGQTPIPWRERAAQIRESVTRALELDPSLPEALAVQGTLNLYYDWDWPTAERRLKRALDLNPNEGLLYHPYADYLLVMGRLEESLDVVKRGAALDPLSPLTNSVVAGHLNFVRRYDEALELLRRLIQRNPHASLLHGMVGMLLWNKGDYRGALDEMFPPGDRMREAAMGAVASGGARAAARLIARTLASRAGGARALDVAEWYSRAGDVDSSLDWLEKGYANRAPFLLHLKANPVFDPLRADPRFRDLLKRIGFPG